MIRKRVVGGIAILLAAMLPAIAFSSDSSVTRPNLGLTSKWATGDTWGAKFNANMDKLDLLTQTAVKDKDLATPPGSPANGDAYIVGASPTGSWTGHAKDVAIWIDSAWIFYTPKEGWITWVNDENLIYAYDGANWLSYSSGGGGGGGVAGGQTRYALLTPMDLGTSPAQQEIINGANTDFLQAAFGNTGDNELVGAWVVPGDFVALTSIKLIIADTGADTGNSQWFFGMEKLTDTGQADITYTHSSSIAVPSPGANYKVAFATFGSLGLTMVAGDVEKVKIQRLTTDPPDTATLSKRFIGILVTYTN